MILYLEVFVLLIKVFCKFTLKFPAWGKTITNTYLRETDGFMYFISKVSAVKQHIAENLSQFSVIQTDYNNISFTLVAIGKGMKALRISLWRAFPEP